MGTAVIDDDRSIPQRQADALVEIMRHVLGCTQTLAPLASVTTITRIDLDALRTGLGLGSIDGIDQPVSAGTIRRLAATADLIPMVLGTDSVPLDVGRTARLFSKAQRLALHERDGGCASCGQNINYTHAHHIRWWKRHRGRTDITNGVLLCSFCHHMIHRDGWDISATLTEVWFIPPPHVDPERAPRLGGKARFSLPGSRRHEGRVSRGGGVDLRGDCLELGAQSGIRRLDEVLAVGEDDHGNLGATADGLGAVGAVFDGLEVDVVVLHAQAVEEALGAAAVAAPLGAEHGDAVESLRSH